MKTIGKDYLNKEKLSPNIYIPHTLRDIPRANDPNKKLSMGARYLASDYYSLIVRSKNKFIVIDHNFISTITEVGSKQNNNIHKELLEIFDIKLHRSIMIRGRKYRNVFVIQFAENTQSIFEDVAELVKRDRLIKEYLFDL